MKYIFVFALLVLLLAGNVIAQPTPPGTPPSPESQGIQIPQASSSSTAPPSAEASQALTASSQSAAYSAASSYQTTAQPYQTTASYKYTTAPYQAVTTPYQPSVPSYPTTTGTSSYAATYMVVPQGVPTQNKFYIPYAPSTVAGCYYGQWLPMWLDVQGWGPLYSYEWYPNGQLVTKYLTTVPYPGWQKMWFNGDAPGWHTLMYYCNGWSNYIYVYVYGSYYPPYNPGYYPTSYPTSPYPINPYVKY